MIACVIHTANWIALDPQRVLIHPQQTLALQQNHFLANRNKKKAHTREDDYYLQSVN